MGLPEETRYGETQAKTPAHQSRRTRTSELQKKLAEELALLKENHPESLIEFWAQDEHRLGLKPLLRHEWVPRGEHPSAAVHHRFEWSYLYGFVQPQSGQTFFLILPLASTTAFSIALAHFAKEVGAGASKQILLMLDRASWHLSQKVVVPEGINIIHLPPYSPELQPAERLWLLTDEPLENRYFKTIEALEAVLAERCVVLEKQPELVQPHTNYHWLPS